jgi:hypothetical protein
LSISATAIRHTNGETAMQYMLLIYIDENSLSDSDRASCYEASAQFARQLNAAGKYVAAAPLYPTATATSVRPGTSRPIVTDGPFAETREQLGGFFLIDADNIDEAIDIASRIPAGKFGTVEIRPVIQVAGLPESSSAAVAMKQ